MRSRRRSLSARSALSRLFLTRSSVCVSRTEVGVLRNLNAGPRRITELAAEERVTQPAITLLVNRLEERGWVKRFADPSDGRAVLVSLTPVGEGVSHNCAPSTARSCTRRWRCLTTPRSRRWRPRSRSSTS